jgi:hypothetical protein
VAVPVSNVVRLVTMRSLPFVCTAKACGSTVAEQLLEVDTQTRRATTPLRVDLSERRANSSSARLAWIERTVWVRSTQAPADATGTSTDETARSQ